MQDLSKYGRTPSRLLALYPSFSGNSSPRNGLFGGSWCKAELQAALGQCVDLNIYCSQEPQKGPLAPKHLPLPPSLSSHFLTHSVLSSRRNSQPPCFSKTHIPLGELTRDGTNSKMCRTFTRSSKEEGPTAAPT